VWKCRAADGNPCVLPLQFQEGETAASLGLAGDEVFDVTGLEDGGASLPRQLAVTAQRADGSRIDFSVRLRIDTPKEVEYYRHGGILEYVLRQLA